MSPARSLEDRLKAEIALSGPIGVAEYMTRCLHDPVDGYYATRPALGPDGDFITAPMVSQMFGELIGLWAVEAWRRLGAPARVHLVELGPGDGTLMGDVLRAARLDPAFLSAVRLSLVEVSPPLRALQRRRLAGETVPVAWCERVEDLPGDGPLIVLANEFLDCLPARQFVRTPEGWREQVIGLDGEGALAFGLAPSGPEAALPVAPNGPHAASGEVWEVSPAQEALASELGLRIVAQGGAALLIDYGAAGDEPGDTLQALSGHHKVDPLATPGQADLTVWARFAAVVRAARAEGAQLTPVIGQGEFLRRLGLEQRAAALSRARPDQSGVLARQVERLSATDQMGSLFKVCVIHGAGLVPPGFEEAS